MAASQIVISGDASQLRQDFETIAKSVAAIGKNLSEALSQGANPAAKLKGVLEQVEKVAQSLGGSMAEAKEKFLNIGEYLKLTGSELEEFAEKQTKAFEKQSTQSFIDNLREIQKLTGMSNDEMLKFAETFGELGKKFEPKSDLQWWLDDRMKSLAKGSDDKLASFYDKTIPDSLGKARRSPKRHWTRQWSCRPERRHGRRRQVGQLLRAQGHAHAQAQAAAFFGRIVHEQTHGFRVVGHAGEQVPRAGQGHKLIAHQARFVKRVAQQPRLKKPVSRE